MLSLFSVLIRDKAHVLWSGNLILPNVISFPNKTVKADKDYTKYTKRLQHLALIL